MSLKSLIVPNVTQWMMSEGRLNRARAKHERNRKRRGHAHTVEFFHDPSDPYSQLLHTVLPDFTARYDVVLKTHVVGPPDEGAAPERDKLRAYSISDTKQLAEKAGIAFDYIETAPASDTMEADARRDALGHYLGGTLYYAREWYWGLDRLHYLEGRLTAMGLRRPDSGSAPIYAPPDVPSATGQSGAALHWYLSFRSPYTAIVRDRVKALADAYGAELKLRFVLPMVMRGLPVPPAKRRYIPLDTAREARRLDVPFGRIVDPVGEPVEMGYSLLPWAREQGRGYEYARNWLAAVWSEGLDAGRERGLKQIVDRSGLSWSEARTHLGSDDWRAEAEANRQEMMDRGIWGVPSFRVGDTITWGQDRLWVIEDELKRLATANAGEG